jgi:hypothetical protein
MIIKGISRKGKNKIHEGLGTEVVVVLENHPSHPPAVLVAPISDPTISSKFSRWIRLRDDPDFEIVEP